MELQDYSEKKEHFSTLKAERAVQIANLEAEVKDLEADVKALEERKARAIAEDNQTAYLKAESALSQAQGKLKFKIDRLNMINQQTAVSAGEYAAERAAMKEDILALLGEECSNVEGLLKAIRSTDQTARENMAKIWEAYEALRGCAGAKEDGFEPITDRSFLDLSGIIVPQIDQALRIFSRGSTTAFIPTAWKAYDRSKSRATVSKTAYEG